MAGRNIILNRSTPMSPADLKTQAKAAGLALYNIDTGGNIIGFLDSLGNPVAPKIYPLGGQPYPWETDKGAYLGSKVMIDPASCLSGIGATVCPIQLINHGDVWAPDGEQILYSSFGSYATPAATVAPPGVANTEVSFFSTSNRPVIPALFLYLGIGVRIKFTAIKDADVAATASTFRCRMGTQNAVNTNNTVAGYFTGAAASQQITEDRIARITTLGIAGTGKFTTESAAKLFTAATVSTDQNAGDYTTNFSTAQDLYVFINHVVNNTTSSAYLVNFQISLVP